MIYPNTIKRTASGLHFDLLNPDERFVDLHDISLALGGICRFNGMTLEHYSVAQHLVNVSNVVGQWIKDWPEKDQFMALACALFHDAHEAYTGDTIAPLKAAVRKLSGLTRSYLDDIEADVQNVIDRKLGLIWTGDIGTLVHKADKILLFAELVSLFNSSADDMIAYGMAEFAEGWREAIASKAISDPIVPIPRDNASQVFEMYAHTYLSELR